MVSDPGGTAQPQDHPNSWQQQISGMRLSDSPVFTKSLEVDQWLITVWKEYVIANKSQQGGVQQPGAPAGSAPKYGTELQDHPDSDQQEDIWDEEGLFSGLSFLKTSP